MTVPSIITGSSITVLVNGKTLVAKTAHPNFNAIKEALKAGAPDVAALAALFSIEKAVETKSEGAVVVRDGVVLYQGKPLHNTLTQRMLAMLHEGFDISPLVNFLTRLMKNPSFRAVNGLYDFLAATNIPITPDGRFLAFKKVRGDYFDIYSGTIRNAVGDEPRVERHQVDEDPDRTCSHGLHVCSESYLPHFGSAPGNRVVIVEVDPADVVAIPKDYNNAKMRCCGYKVIGEVAYQDVRTTFTAPVMSADDFTIEEEDDRWYDEEEDEDYLDSEPTEVIKNVDGVTVTFKRDENGEWTAVWQDPDGDEASAFVGDTDLDDAVDNFRDDHLESVVDYTAEFRWLDEDGELQKASILMVYPTEDGEPAEWEFFDEASTQEIDVGEDAKVVKITKVEGTERKRAGYGF